MKLMEFYDSINNPIDDDQVIEELIACYANRSKGVGGFYGQITETVDKKTGVNYKDDVDKFHSMMFNKWKNRIVSMTDESLKRAYGDVRYNKYISKLKDYLKTIPDVSTKEEANKILYSKKDDSDLEEAFSRFSWSSVGFSTGWIFAISCYTNPNEILSFNVEHRLYINTESLDTYKFANLFIEKCDEHKMPYYFKFDDYGNRDDTLVIYSSTEYLTKYLDILKEIKRDNPELVSNIKKPPLLSGKVDNWIGYGTEPEYIPERGKVSFNSIRADAIEDIIDKNIKKWVLNHLNDRISFRGQKISFYDFIVKLSIDDINSFIQSKNNGEIDSYELNNLVNNNLITMINKVCSGDKDCGIDINLKNGKKVSYRGFKLEELIEELSAGIIKYDPSVKRLIKEQIKKDAVKNGIDPNKYCFDTYVVEKMKNYSEDDLSITDIHVLVRRLNPFLLKKKVTLPNGISIPAKQYIEEFYYPYMPENGIVTLINGTSIPVKQYIEEILLGDVLEVYNGDIDVIIENTTIQNDNINSNSDEQFNKSRH